jgi:hypothetical protein
MKTKLLLFRVLFLSILLNAFPVTAQNIPDFLVNEQGSIDGSQQTTPSIAGDGNGNYVLTWKDKRNGSDFDIFAQMYNSEGLPLGNNFKVNDDIGSAKQYRPVVSVDPNLNFVIAWIDRRNGDPNTDWEVYAQRFFNDGTPLGDNFKVNDELETAEKDHPSISIDSIGNFVIVWADKRSSPWDIYGQRFLNDGTALGDNFRINDDIGNYWQLWPTSSCDKSGNLIVSWVDERDNTDRQIYAQRFSPDGTVLGNNFKVNTDITGTNHICPDIAIDGNSNFIIAWEDNRNGHFDIFAQRYLNDGSTLGDNFMINEDSPTTSQRNPSISSDVEGNFTVCWEDNRNDYNDVYARRYSNDGIPLSDDFKVNNDSTDAQQENSVIAADDDGNFIICWEDRRFSYNGEIFAQSFLNDGTAVDQNFMVNDDAGSENQQWPSIAVDGSENFIIVWADNRLEDNGIYAQRFSSDGTVLGTNYKVNDDSGQNYAFTPSVAANSDGSFVIAWADFRSQSCYEIYAQRFSADGTPLGSNFKVNYLSACMNFGPVVVCKQNGDFIITWADADEGGKEYVLFQNLESKLPSKKLNGEPDIWAQQYLSDGTPIGENFKVNDDSGYTLQMYPDIAVDANGNFTITWEDNRNGPWEIYLQQYFSDGTPLGGNFKVEDAIYCDWAVYPSICMDESGNFIVVWQDDRNDYYDIFCRRFLNNGTPIANSFQVNSETGAGHQSHPRVSIQDDGRFIITWMEDQNGTNDIYAQRYWSDALPYSDNFQIPNTQVMDQSCQDVILKNNLIYTTWHDNKSGQTGYDIWANILDWDVGVGIDNDLLPEISSQPCLYQNYPNPFYSSTKISYSLNEPGSVALNIYDLQGRKIKSLVNEFQKADTFSVIVDGNELTTGIYFYKLEVGKKYMEVKKLMLIR